MALNQREKIIGGIFGVLAVIWLMGSRPGTAPSAKVNAVPAAPRVPIPENLLNAGKPAAETASTDALHVLDKVLLRSENKQSSGDLLDPFKKFEAKDLMDRKILELSELKLKGIIRENGTYVALINDQILHAGEVVSGFRIADIHANEVILIKGSEKHTLRLFEEL